MDRATAVSVLTRAIPLSCKARSGDLCDKPCVKKIEDALYTAARHYGFEYLRYTCWVQDIAPTQLEKHSFSINFSNFPEPWEKQYEQRQSYMTDPVLRALQENSGALVTQGSWHAAWDYAAQHPLGHSDKEQHHYLRAIEELRTQARKHGLHDGIYMLINLEARKLVISLASSEPKPDIPANAQLWQELFALMHLSYHAMSLTKQCEHCGRSLRFGGDNTIALTKTQVEILRQFANHTSASTTDIAKVQHVSINTINFHLKTIRRKFNKPNASGHALATIAREHGLI